MSKFVRAGTALALAGALIVAAGGIASAKTVDDGKYAKAVCGSLKTFADSTNKAIGAFNSLDTSDPAAFQTNAAGLFDKVVADTQAAQKKLKKVSPQDGGKGVTKTFDRYFNEITGKLSDAIAKFRAADPTGVAFAADVSTLNVAINLLTTGASDPFSKIKEQDLLGAFKTEKSCNKFVTIFGG